MPPLAARSMNKGVEMRPIDFLKACVFESIPEAEQVGPACQECRLGHLRAALLACEGVPCSAAWWEVQGRQPGIGGRCTACDRLQRCRGSSEAGTAVGACLQKFRG